jgi:SAM-dependent methyltransferase
MTTGTAFDWSAVAPAWDQRRRHTEDTTEPITAALLAPLELRRGARVLELGAGTGDLARRLCEAVGEEGRVLATDAAAGMVAITARTLAPFPQATTAQVDAAATGLPDASFDTVVFAMGLMFVPEPELAVAETRRVLREGGRASFSVWGAPEHNPWLRSLGMAAAAVGVVAGGPPTGPGGLFSLSEPARLEAVLATAFKRPQVQSVPVSFDWPDADSWFDHVSQLSGPLAVAIAAQPDKHQALRETASQLVAPYLDGAGLHLPGLALVGTATA